MPAIPYSAIQPAVAVARRQLVDDDFCRRTARRVIGTQKFVPRHDRDRVGQILSVEKRLCRRTHARTLYIAAFFSSRALIAGSQE